MAQPYRDIVDEVVTAIGASAISGVSSWKFYREEPIYHQAVGQNCAVFFDGFEMTENGTTGDREELARFIIRYWEPAPEKPTMVVDETAAATVEAIFDGLLTVMYANQGGLGNAYQSWVVAGQKFIGREGDAALRGCEVAFTSRIRRAFG